MDEIYLKAVDYLKDVGEDDRVLILHHWDMDGSASAAILSKILEEVRGKGADLVKIPEGRKHGFGRNIEKVLEDEGVSKLIVVDMSVEGERADRIQESGVDVLNIDHHDFGELPEKVPVVNPRIEDDDVYVPAAKICNDIARKFGLNLDWIAGLGIIQDFAVEQNKHILEKLKKQYPNYFPETIGQQEMAKNCRYGTYSNVLNVKPYKDTEKCAKLAFQALVNAKSLKHLEAQDEYSKVYQYYQEADQEFHRIREKFDSEKEEYVDLKLVFFQFSSPYHINSSIATSVSLERHDWIHIIVKMEDEKAQVSSRCQSGRVDLGEILRDALPEDAGEGAEAGGHRNAAGA
ncbi:MAG: DHH family phosphoesterase, partial [Candidatus Nanohaloarchaea archaeon]|nr:DHH family phosphoesterase [Candidatus Nanohaloarchaea archaeon]